MPLLAFFRDSFREKLRKEKKIEATPYRIYEIAKLLKKGGGLGLVCSVFIKEMSKIFNRSEKQSF